jgi:hypothetical protein
MSRKCSSCGDVGHRSKSSYCPATLLAQNATVTHSPQELTGTLPSRVETHQFNRHFSSDHLSNMLYCSDAITITDTCNGSVGHQSLSHGNNCVLVQVTSQDQLFETMLTNNPSLIRTCSTCGVQGHHAGSKYCLSVINDAEICTACGVQGHGSLNCNRPSMLNLPQTHRCFTCGIAGHHSGSKYCLAPTVMVAEISCCIACGSEGHNSNTCVNQASEVSDSFPTQMRRSCANCPGAFGLDHRVETCTVRCNKCHIHGHSEANCTYLPESTRNWVSKCAVKWSKTCPICGCMFLCSESLAFMKKCCLSGNVQCNWWPELKPLPESYYQIIKYNEGNFSR